MSNFGQALERALKQKGLKAVDLHDSTGLAESKISRWISRKQSYIEISDLQSICLALGDDVSPALVLAHLQDCCPEDYRHLIVTPDPGAPWVMNETTARPSPPNYTRLEGALEILRAHGDSDPDARAIILDLARLLTPREARKHVTKDSLIAGAQRQMTSAPSRGVAKDTVRKVMGIVRKSPDAAPPESPQKS